MLLPLCVAGCARPPPSTAATSKQNGERGMPERSPPEAQRWISASIPERAHPGGEPDEEIMRLVVMIRCREIDGAGIIFGVDEGHLYIATVAHVVGHCPSGVRVKLRGLERQVEANVLRRAGDRLDLAAVSVANPRKLGVDVDGLSFTRLGVSPIARRDAVYALGNPSGNNWSVSSDPDRVARIENDEVIFDSMFIRTGHSGGALLNDRWEIIGLLRADEPPTGVAISIARVIETLREWKYPVKLQPSFPRVSAGGDRTCVVNPEGTVRCWGDLLGENTSETLTLSGARFKSVSVGLRHACGVTFDGTASCWGVNNYGQLGNGSDANSFDVETGVQQGPLVFASVAAGGFHTCAVTIEGSAFCWGHGAEGRLGNNSGHDSRIPVPVSGGLRFTSITAGLRNTCGLTTSGSVYCWGGMSGTGLRREGTESPNTWSPALVLGNITFKSVAAGQHQLCGLAANNDVYCWGSNEDGALGNGSTTEIELTPVRVATALKFRSVTAGLGGHACGISTNGAAFCWGQNTNGSLGNGTKTRSSVPVPVSGNLRFVELSAGVNHTCGVSTDRSIYCWGSDRFGLGTGTATGSTRPARAPMLQ
ncbi:trypsin-like peptidase domain-containing protein [Sorangium sp. So ce367]|uniref:RCC1 domain-containing protein n=1 Tax=Sorangium sp. So ce367 TaxID=3133305 RepID=UPI003F5FF86B